MKITSLRCAVVKRSYDGAARNTRHAWHSKNYVLVELRTEQSLRGIGEMYCDGGGSPEVAVAMLRHEMAPHVVGRDAALPGAIVAGLRDRMALSARASAASLAISAIDIALWDLMGHASGQPCHRLLGGASDRVRVYASGGMYGPNITPATLAAEMAAAQRTGLCGVKIKIGAAALEEDLERVARMREAIGPRAPLMVDAMFAPSVPEAIALGKALAPYDLHFLEAPTSPYDVSGWKAVADATGLALAGPELSDDTDLMLRMLQAGAVRYLQFDVAIAGGLSGGRNLAALGLAYHRSVSLHCAASAVAMAAGAHLGAALGHCDGLEFHVMHDGLRERLWSNGWRLADGYLVVPGAPGLGIVLGEEENDLLEQDTCCVA